MSDRDPEYVSNRVLLCNASVYDIKDKYEAECLSEYQVLVNKVWDAHEEISNIQKHIKEQTKQSKIEELKSSIKKIENQIVKYDVKLSQMESEYPLRYVIQRLRGIEQAGQDKQGAQVVHQKKADPQKKLEGTEIKHLNKRTIIIAACVILGIALIALTLSLILTTGTVESEYTITYYNNKGIYFTNSTSKGELKWIKYQDTTVYKLETFSGGYPSEPTPPTNEGYIFLGWYQNPECTEKFLFGHYEINSDINLYAKWGK